MMGGTWCDTEDKTKMARYSKYLDLVPMALLQEYGVDIILTAWPLRQISKKPRLHPYAVPWSDPTQKYVSHTYIRNDPSVPGGLSIGPSGSSSSGGSVGVSNSVTFISTTGLPIPSTSTNVPHLTLSLVNSNNSNNNARNIKVYRSRGILNECNYSNSFRRIDTLGNKGRAVTGSLPGNLMHPDNRMNNIQSLNQRTRLPFPHMYPIPVYNNDGGSIGKIVNNNQRYSAVICPQVKLIKGNQSKSLEQDERIRRDKLRKLIYNCTVELSISSPLTCKLRERLSSILPKVSANISQGYEKYCTTHIRSHYSDFLPYNSHLHPHHKPSRTLRSNTSIIDEKAPVSTYNSYSKSKSYVHHYSFSRKQRYHRWAQIEDKFNSAQEQPDSDSLISSESDNSNDSDIKSNTNLTAWLPTSVISTFPIIDFDEIAEAQREKEARSRLHYHAEYSNCHFNEDPPYVISFVPDESNNTIPKETITNLPPSLGYEIILEPMNLSTTSQPPQPPSTSSSSSSSSSSPSSPSSTSTSASSSLVKPKREKHEVIKIDRNLVKSEVELVQKSNSENPKKDIIPLRRSLRREQTKQSDMLNKTNSIVNGTTRSSIRVEHKRNQLHNNKNSSSVCDITLSNVSDGNFKPSFSKQMLKTEDVVIKHLSSSTESMIKVKSIVKTNQRIQEKLIPLEPTTISNLRKINHISSQSIRQSKRPIDDEVMIIRTKDDLPRKKVDTDDVVMIKVMQAAKRPRLRK